MAKAKWTPFPYPAKEFAYAVDALKKNWGRLHKGDCEPFPRDPAPSPMLEAIPAMVHSDLRIARPAIRENPCWRIFTRPGAIPAWI